MNYKITNDILIGTWEGGADDGSGLRTMVFNYGIIFNDDETGIIFSWNKEKDKLEEYEDKIEWKLIDNETIGIKYILDSNNSNIWEYIRIEISDFIGAYEGKYFKMVDKDKETFYYYSEPLYKIKQRSIGKFFSLIWSKIERFNLK